MIRHIPIREHADDRWRLRITAEGRSTVDAASPLSGDPMHRLAQT
jgi:hypothetical protein